MSQQPIKIPTRADDPPRVLVWTIDEFLPIVIGFSVGILVHQIFICTALGIGASMLLAKNRDSNADGAMFHWVYSKGLGFTKKSKSLLNPFIKIFFP